MKHLLIPILLLASTSYAAGIQKWVDENGQIHYGDSPPVKSNPEPIRVTRPPSNPGRSLPRFTGETEEESAEAEQPSEQTQAPPAAPETPEDEAKEFCERAQKDQKVLNRSQRIRLKQSDGTTRFMTSEEIEARKKQTEDDIKQYCK